MSDKIDPELLRKFLHDECDEHEYQQVRNWVNASANEEEVLAFIEKYWDSDTSQGSSGGIDYEKVLGKIKRNIEGKAVPLRPFVPRRSLARQSLKIVAVLLFPMLVLGIYYLTLPSAEDLRITYEEKVNQRGQKSKISLPDGTVVWLNAESKLRYISDFMNGEREVVLEGEAFFDVAENKELPFKVITRDVQTVALGTSFNINAFPENEVLGISLVSGKVAIRHQAAEYKLDEIVLNPGEKLEVNPVTNDFIKENFDYKKEASWRQGVIYFENADIEHVRTTLERWFNVNIVFTNQAKRPWHFSGEFDNSSLERVLERMAYTEKFSFELSESTVIIEFE